MMDQLCTTMNSYKTFSNHRYPHTSEKFEKQFRDFDQLSSDEKEKIGVDGVEINNTFVFCPKDCPLVDGRGVHRTGRSTDRTGLDRTGPRFCGPEKKRTETDRILAVPNRQKMLLLRGNLVYFHIFWLIYRIYTIFGTFSG